jgi:hypothetical protein
MKPSSTPRGGSAPPSRSDAIDAVGQVWNRFWFMPADGRLLSLVRIGAAAIALLLWWSHAADLHAWFGPAGILPVDVVREWRSPFGFSLFDHATSPTALTVLFGATGVVFTLLLVGFATPLVALLAAVLWASLLHRGPMLAGPADDCLSVLFWCLAIGRAGDHVSLDRWLADRVGRPVSEQSVRSAVALGLLRVHASAITVAAVLAQLKGDAWWDGLAGWYLAAGPGSWAAGLPPLFQKLLGRSEYATNLLTHGITAFEILFAVGLWFEPTRRPVCRLGLVAWPLVGLVAGEPCWGLAMAVFSLAGADLWQAPDQQPDPR